MDKKENHLQKLLKKRASLQSSTDSLAPKKDLAAILTELVAAFPTGCFCPPSQQTITQIENALNDLLVWSASAPISNSLKLELQNAINAVIGQLDANPFSCCDTIKALQVLQVVLGKVVAALQIGTSQLVDLLNLLQQLQTLFVGYLACLACEPECETTGIFANPAPIIIDSTPPAPTLAIPYPSEIEVTGLCPSIKKVTATLKNLTHARPGGIDILLVGPEEQTVILMSDTGQNNPTSNVTLTFDDDAPTLLPEFNPIVSGTFKPSNYSGLGTESFPIPAPIPPYGATLSVFNGTNPNGTWKLFVVDDSPPVGGSIADGWELNITAV